MSDKPAVTAEEKLKLALFYGVDNEDELIAAMLKHISRLQERAPSLSDAAVQFVRA
jgi:hypothetical protein